MPSSAMRFIANMISLPVISQGTLPSRHYLTPPQARTERLPNWFKIIPKTGNGYLKIRRLAKELDLHTVCEEAQCPNRWECWNAGTATFMILGGICTRSCGFCSVPFGKPTALDHEEPSRLAEAIATLGIKHAVITSVNRDELENGGAEIFAESVRKIREKNPDCTVELLIPDFQGKGEALDIVLSARPHIIGHNIETVPRLYKTVRPQAKYCRSLQVLSRAKRERFMIKTGMMVGLGESLEEVFSVIGDLIEVGCDILTIGQYLQPTQKHVPVDRFVAPEEFLNIKEKGEAMGLRYIEAGPLVRSSYHAERQLKEASV